MKKKAWIVIIISIIVIIGCIAFSFMYGHQEITKQGSQSARNSVMTPNKKKQSSSAKTRKNNYNPNQLMLMGYMAYAHDNYVQSRHIQNNSDLVNDVQQDLNDGNLIASRDNNNSYTVTNAFGSVQIDVAQSKVIVVGDGNHIENAAELNKDFGSYNDQINAMTAKINSSQNMVFNLKQLGIFAGYLRGGKNWVKGCINQAYKAKHIEAEMSGCMSYGPGRKGFYMIDGHGDPTTTVTYKLDGNTLVTGHIDLKPGKSVGDSPVAFKKYPMNQVVAKYYSTPEEKAEVDQLACRLLSDAEFNKKVKDNN